MKCKNQVNGLFVAYTLKNEMWYYCNNTNIVRLGNYQELLKHTETVDKKEKFLQQAFYNVRVFNN